MSTLRKCLKLPQTYFAVFVVLLALAAVDSTRAAQNQWTAKAYLSAVRLYQGEVSPKLSGHIQCRFEPTCSHYSAEAVRRFGIREGLVLTARRLWRCRSSVPLGTRDEVPSQESDVHARHSEQTARSQRTITTSNQ